MAEKRSFLIFAIGLGIVGIITGGVIILNLVNSMLHS
jgi:hypothetical protein